MHSTRHKLFILLLLSCILSGLDAKSSIPTDSVFQWKPVKEVINLMKTEPRPIMVFFYDPKDDSSILMLNSILNKKELITYANPKFYLVRIDVSDSSILWLNSKTYTRKGKEYFNPLVKEVIGDSLKFPSLLFFNKESSGTVFMGYRSRYEMRCLLVYYAEEIVTSTPYHLWFQAYQRAYPPINLPQPIAQPIHWLTLKEAMALQKKEPRILLINWYARLNVGSQVMLYNAFESTKVSDFLNRNFYCVRLDAQTNDTLFWLKSYYNSKSENKFHQLALEQLKGEMKFPSFVFYTPGKKLIYSHQTYLGPVKFYALLHYVFSESYKTKRLQDYFKTFNPNQ